MINSETFDFHGKTYEYNNLECVYKKDGEFIDIKKAVPDIGIRMTEYNNVIAIKTDIYKYKIDAKNNVVRKVIYVKKYRNKAVENRRKNWKPFGVKNNDTKSYKFIGEPVSMEYADENGRLLSYNDDFVAKSTNTKSTNVKSTNVKSTKFSTSSTYKPNISIINNVKDNSVFKINNVGYIPSSIKNKMDKNVGLTNFSIIIKNIPTNLERYDVECELKTKFSEFGTIKKVTVLMDKYEPTKIREIAFIDFSFASEAISALKSTKRICIGSCILSKEMAKKK